MSDALRKAAGQALAFLTALDQDDNDRDFLHESQCRDIDRAMKALRAALAEPEPSPTYWAISRDGVTPDRLWPDGQGDLLDLEVKRIGGACRAMKLVELK